MNVMQLECDVMSCDTIPCDDCGAVNVLLCCVMQGTGDRGRTRSLRFLTSTSVFSSKRSGLSRPPMRGKSERPVLLERRGCALLPKHL